MYSVRLLKKIAKDVPPKYFSDYIGTLDIGEREQISRIGNLINFWAKNRSKFYRLQKRANLNNGKMLDNINAFGNLLLQFKAVCDGKEPTAEVIDEYGVEDWKLMLVVVNGCMKY